MEQQTLLLPKNKKITTLIIGVAAVALGIALMIFNRYWAPMEGEPVDITTVEDSVANIEQVGNVLGIIPEGRGELTFMVSAKASGTIVREIQLYNPLKDSWVIVYDGYKTLSETPTEVFRAGLAAMTYSKVQVRTLDRFFAFDRPITVVSGVADMVVLNLE